MSVIDGIPLLLGGEGYQISRSVRLRSSATANFTRTLSASNRKTWTWSAWVKRGLLANRQALFSAGLISGTFHYHTIHFDSNDKLNVVFYPDTTSTTLITTQVFRDPSAWYHLVVAFDTTQATAANRVKVYVNGSQVTAFDTASYSAQNTDGYINSAAYNSGVHYIGRFTPSDTAYLDGYLTEINFIDGQALTPSSFGETDAITGVWKPKKYAGTYGTNGFYLNFSDNSGVTANTIGRDRSGNNNDWTPNNISVTAGATYDSMLDVPTLWADGGNGRGNYATLNPLNANSGTISNGNLSQLYASASYQTAIATFGMSSGKWYCEITCTAIGGTGDGVIGIAALQPISTFTGNTATSYGWYSKGSKYNNGTGVSYNGGATWTTNSVIGVAFDADAGTLTFYKDGVSQGDAYTGIAANTYFIAVSSYSSTTYACNFGQRPFAYTPPSGFKALNTQNLPEPTIKKANAYFDVSTWTGDNTTNRTITNAGGFQPDLVWTKGRSTTWENFLQDSVRGAPNFLISNSPNAEATTTPNIVSSFAANGFVVQNNGNSNSTGSTYVAWQWKEGATQGFDIVTYTGNGVSGLTVAHSLGVAPRMIIIKNRASNYNWRVGHSSLPSWSFFMQLDGTNAQTNNNVIFNGTAPTSSVFTVGNDVSVNASGQSHVAYCFAAVAGYSAFGSYTGNGSSDGPFVFTGFRPAFVLVKASSNSTSSTVWTIFDTRRSSSNAAVLELFPNSSVAENTDSSGIDILSNGFKPRRNSEYANSNGWTYIYAAFAESPFKLSLAR